MLKERLRNRSPASLQARRVKNAASAPKTGESPFRIEHADHTGFTVSSLEESLAFWVGTLQFRLLYIWTFDKSLFIEQLVGVPDAALRLAMVEGPGHSIELLEYTAPDDRKIYKPRSSDVGSVHLAFYVENIEALVARCTCVGWPSVCEIQTVESGERKGVRLVYIRGPDGVTIEFIQRPCSVGRSRLTPGSAMQSEGAKGGIDG
jgi:catechol 2,3-dioxygenase-like lactoylglutathione lyase family enzyme